MRLTVVGCSGSFPGPVGPASCYLLEADGVDASGSPYTYRVLLDLGSGSLGPLQRYTALESIDAIALTHLHPDHCLDACGLYVYLKYRPGGPSPRRPLLLGPAGSAKRLARAYDLPLVPGMHSEFDIESWTPEVPVHVGPMTLVAHRVEHPVPAFAIRVEGPNEQGDGRSVLAYSGDTDVCEGLLANAAGADLFLCEAAFVEGRDLVRGVHLTGARAGQVATDAGVGSLLLTHIPPWNDPERTRAEAKQTWDGELALAEPGMVIHV